MFRKVLAKEGLLRGCLFEHRIKGAEPWRWSFAWPLVHVAVQVNNDPRWIGRLNEERQREKDEAAKAQGWQVLTLNHNDVQSHHALERVRDALASAKSTEAA